MKFLTCLCIVVLSNTLVLNVIKPMDMSVHFGKVPVLGASCLSCLCIIFLDKRLIYITWIHKHALALICFPSSF